MLQTQQQSLTPSGGHRKSATRENEVSSANRSNTKRPSSLRSPSRYAGSGARVVCNRYVLGRTLGGGVEGKVKRCLDLETDKEVAIKIIDMKNIQGHSKALLRIKNEIKILEHLNHPNIVCLHAFHTNVDYPRKRGGYKKCILIIMELVEGGELFPYLQFTGCFSEPICRMFLKQLASALHHCKQNSISHRDIKPENIFLTKDFQLKLGDFGLSSIHEDASIADTAANGNMKGNSNAEISTLGRSSNRALPQLLSSYVGTDSYMAPEILQGKRYNGSAVDVWSLGMVFFIMLSGFPPLQRADMNDWYFKRLVKQQYDAFWKAHERSMSPLSLTIKDLVLQMLHPDPSKRITIEGVLNHAFMRNTPRTSSALTKDGKNSPSSTKSSPINGRERTSTADEIDLLQDLRMRRCAVEDELRKERRRQGKVSTPGSPYMIVENNTSESSATSSNSSSTRGPSQNSNASSKSGGVSGALSDYDSMTGGGTSTSSSTAMFVDSTMVSSDVSNGGSNENNNGGASMALDGDNFDPYDQDVWRCMPAATSSEEEMQEGKQAENESKSFNKDNEKENKNRAFVLRTKKNGGKYFTNLFPLAPRDIELSVDHLNVWIPSELINVPVICTQLTKSFQENGKNQLNLNKQRESYVDFTLKILIDHFQQALRDLNGGGGGTGTTATSGGIQEEKESEMTPSSVTPGLVAVLKKNQPEGKMKLRMKVQGRAIVLSVKCYLSSQPRSQPKVIAAITRKSGSSLLLQQVMQKVSMKFRSIMNAQ